MTEPDWAEWPADRFIDNVETDTRHALATVLASAFATPDVVDGGAGGFTPGLYETACGRTVSGTPARGRAYNCRSCFTIKVARDA